MAAELSLSELRKELTSLNTPKERLAACVERQEFEALLTEMRAAKPAEAQQPASAAATTTTAAPTSSTTAAPTTTTPAAAGGQPAPLPQAKNEGWSFTNIFIGIFIAFQAAQFLGLVGGGGAFDESVPVSDAAFLAGNVSEVRTHTEFKDMLGYHRDKTGLPVVVDFYSRSCGPCVSIAPTFHSLAKEMAGKAVMVQVDTSRNYETSRECNVRAMPTFSFYLNGKLLDNFAGADTRRLRQTTASAVRDAERLGTFVGREIGAEELQAFYAEHDASKAADAPRIAAEYANATAKLVRRLRQKYSAEPATRAAPNVTVAAPPPPSSSSSSGGGGLAGASADDLRAELRRRDAAAAAAAEAALGAAAPPHTSAAAPAEVVVLGGGPAGLAAALYAARAGLKPVLIAPVVGGQLQGKGVDVENFPGVPSGSGVEIVRTMRAQCAAFGARGVDDLASAVDLSARPFRVTLNATADVVHARAIIVATGADARWLGAPGEYEYLSLIHI